MNEIRRGDDVIIPGDYQHRARTAGFVVQRYWHYEKERIVRAFCPPNPGDAALDIGCGSGVISGVVSSLGAHTIGVDSNPTAIDYASQTFGNKRTTFRCCQVEDVGLPDASLDRAYCMELVEHLYMDQAANLLAGLWRLMKPGGRLLLTTPNYCGTWPLLESALDFFRLVPRLKDDQHVTKFCKDRLSKMLIDAGWEIQRLTTFSTIAPFVSILGWSAAIAMSKLEDRINLPFGNVLLAVARRPES